MAGLWLSALGDRDLIQLTYKGVAFTHFNTADIAQMVKDTGLNYEGVNGIQGTSVYVNFVCVGCVFDGIEFNYFHIKGETEFDNLTTGTVYQQTGKSAGPDFEWDKPIQYIVNKKSTIPDLWGQAFGPQAS